MFQKVFALFSLIACIGILSSCDSDSEIRTSRADFSDLGRVRWFAPWDAMQPSKKQTEVSRELEEVLGVRFRLFGVNGGKPIWSQAYRPEVTQDELPDIYSLYSWAVGDTTLTSSAAFTIEELSTYMPAYTRALRDYCRKYEISFDDMIGSYTYDGMLYYVPRIEPWIPHPTGILWRKDILDDLGLEVPKTLDEWEQVFDVFKERYPDSFPGVFSGNGNLTWLGNNLLYRSYGEVNPYGFVFSEGSIQPASFQTGFIDAIQTVRRWLLKGYVRPLTANEQQQRMSTLDVFATGETLFVTGVRAYDGNWVCDEPYLPQSVQNWCRKVNPGAEFVLGPYPSVNDAIPVYNFFDSYRDYVIGFGAHLNDDRERLHGVMRLLDTMGDDTDAFLAAYAGIEGTDWRWMASGDRNYVVRITEGDGRPYWAGSFARFRTYWGLTSTEFNLELLYDPRVLESIRANTEPRDAVYGSDRLRLIRSPSRVSVFVEGLDDFYSKKDQVYDRFCEEILAYISTGNGTPEDLLAYQKTLWNVPYARELLEKATDWYHAGIFY